jgi:signal transduction histidine kinase
MGSSHGPRFELGLGLRLAALLIAVAIAAWLLGSARFRVLPLLLVAVAVAQVVELVRYIAAANRGAARAIDAWRSGDFATAAAVPSGAGYDTLAAALDETAARLAERQRQREQDSRYLEAIVSHAPVPLLAIDGDRVELLNHAARRLLGTPVVTTVDALASVGPGFVRDIVDTPPGERRLSRALVDGAAQYLLVSSGMFTADGQVRRLVSLQGIQSELDARTIDAWLEMARVLAHEIMSSLTPIVSLTATAADRLAEIAAAGDSSELLDEARQAIATAARRSDGLMHFVRRYRELAALPPPDRRAIDAAEVMAGVAALLGPELAARRIALTVDGAGVVTVHADRALLEQALINLVRNAADACEASPEPAVWLGVRQTRGGRIALEVADSGPGVAPAMVETIFVPFFTTKRGGSGIGLSLAQHVARAHGGAITVGDRPGGGAVFAIVLP